MGIVLSRWFPVGSFGFFVPVALIAASEDQMRETMKNNEQMTEAKTIVLRDIEPLLKQKLGDHVVVESFTSENLVPPGENYGSTILKVDVNLKGLSGKEEQIHLIAKMLPPTEFQRLVFNSSKTFFKEIFMYETIMPAYNKLELESGLRTNEIFDFLPKFYGSRASLQPDVDVDDDAVFMMQNLKANGYYHGVRSVGYDYEHSKVAVEALARFHALGMAVKQKKPGLFEVFKMHAKMTPMEADPNNEIFNRTLKVIKEDSEMSVHYDKCKKVIDDIGFTGFWSDIPREPWMTIIHTDFWVNNVLFHQNNAGKIDDLKIIDFQTYTYSSALRDLQLYLFSSVELDVTDEQLETLMDLYYETLIKRLTELKCNTKVFDKEGFWGKMKEDAPYEFIHLALMVKVLTMDVDETEFTIVKMESAISEYEGNKTFVDRLRRLLLYYCKRGWLPTPDETS